ncbi:MAG: methyl-accepting chemotaxis protein, partial [Coriobacteriia bacterium]|nr:methyl-accepting chemotaxis protein [Coriobacteriia bacterium]
MAQEHRGIRVKRGLAFTFTMLTWMTIAPAVGTGLAATAIYAYFYLHLTIADMLPVMAFGATVMVVMSIPGSFAWRWQFNERVLTPLRDLGGTMVEAGKGDLTVRADIIHNDEIGVLADECNCLIESLKDIASHVRRSAETVSAAAAQLSASSQEISSSTMEISSSVQQIAHGAELQSRKVEETSGSIESINGTTNEVAGQAEEAARTS